MIKVLSTNLANTEELVWYKQGYSEISDIAMFCGVSSKIIHKSLQTFRLLKKRAGLLFNFSICMRALSVYFWALSMCPACIECITVTCQRNQKFVFFPKIHFLLSWLSVNIKKLFKIKKICIFFHPDIKWTFSITW